MHCIQILYKKFWNSFLVMRFQESDQFKEKRKKKIDLNSLSSMVTLDV